MGILQKKILSIEKNILVHGYSHNACMFCIAASKVDFWGNDGQIENLVFLKDGNRTENYICEENTDIKSDIKVTILEEGKKKTINTYCSKTKGKGSCFLYQHAEEEIACEVKVDSFRWNNLWSFSGIRLCSENEQNRAEFRIGFAPNNRIAVVRIFKDQEKYESFDNTFEFDCVKVRLDENHISCYFAKDGNEWQEYMVEDNYFPTKQRKIGYFLWTDDEHYKNWFYTNYIQLHASYDLEPNFDVKLDYYTGVKVYDRYNVNNPWIRQSNIDPQLLDNEDIITFIKNSIDHNYYIALMLNEKYVTGTWAYQVQDLDHESMVYGYDMGEKIIFLVGFDKTQHFTTYELSIEMFREAYEKLSKSYELKLMRFEVQPFQYSLDKGLICRMFKEYRDGIDSSHREELNINQPIRCYGMNIYNVLLQNLSGLRDKGIAYILYEHKKNMKNRVEYLYERGCFNKTDYTSLVKMATKLEQLSQILLLLCIKFRIKKNEELLVKIEKKIIELQQVDTLFVEAMIKSLER